MNKSKHWMDFMRDDERPAYERAKAILQMPTSDPVQQRNALEVISALNKWCVKRMAQAAEEGRNLRLPDMANRGGQE